MTRPPVPFAPEPGFEWHAVPDEQWTTEPWRVEGRRCRWGAAKGHPAHGTPAVAIFIRRRYDGLPLPFAYCEEHLYGRWIEDGRVMEWRLVPTG